MSGKMKPCVLQPKMISIYTLSSNTHPFSTHVNVTLSILWHHILGKKVSKITSVKKWPKRSHFTSLQFLRHLKSKHSVWKILKMSHLNFSIVAFSTNFCPIKTDLFGNTVWQASLKLSKLTIVGIFNQLLSIQNVNVAHFARNVIMRLFLGF